MCRFQRRREPRGGRGGPISPEGDRAGGVPENRTFRPEVAQNSVWKDRQKYADENGRQSTVPGEFLCSE